MPNHPERENEHDDALWDVLGEVPRVPVDPYFAKRVAQAAASAPRRASLWGRLLESGVLRFSACASAAAALAIVAAVALWPKTDPVAEELATRIDPPELPEMIEHGLAAVGYVDYFDALVATEDPSLLSDEDLIELIVDDGSSSLLF